MTSGVHVIAWFLGDFSSGRLIFDDDRERGDRDLLLVFRVTNFKVNSVRL